MWSSIKNKRPGTCQPSQTKKDTRFVLPLMQMLIKTSANTKGGTSKLGELEHVNLKTKEEDWRYNMGKYSFSETIEIGEKEYEVEVVGMGHRATPSTSDWNCPMGYPGDPASSEIHHVWAKLPTGSWNKEDRQYTDVQIDLVNVIHEDLLEKFEERLIELAEEDDGRDYEREDFNEEVEEKRGIDYINERLEGHE
jgi:hypothetical protein